MIDIARAVALACHCVTLCVGLALVFIPGAAQSFVYLFYVLFCLDISLLVYAYPYREIVEAEKRWRERDAWTGQ